MRNFILSPTGLSPSIHASLPAQARAMHQCQSTYLTRKLASQKKKQKTSKEIKNFFLGNVNQLTTW